MGLGATSMRGWDVRVRVGERDGARGLGKWVTSYVWGHVWGYIKCGPYVKMERWVELGGARPGVHEGAWVWHHVERRDGGSSHLGYAEAWHHVGSVAPNVVWLIKGLGSF
ncbi:hypothetical protein PIB30_051618 [Stylosanthes scabra]|uniref:Uncharacterized protein n=1 Tax=Stylosanthes scabra TaxID=79078 RepID=A0ABU6SIM8_9FABA|nr:hypothetical protein [Stylosanthes scabra]